MGWREVGDFSYVTVSPFNYPSNVEKKISCTEAATKPNSKLKLLPPPWARGGHFTLCDRLGMID